LTEYRQADESDVPAMAQIRAAEWGIEECWKNRILGYMRCELHPQQALKPRIIYVALQGVSMVGFIAGHLTTRYGCDGELQWINVVAENRSSGTASELLRILAKWFVQQGKLRICVDVDPANLRARKFYMKHGAEELNKHWLVWNDIKLMLHE
jgi:ribosomal protein S18 acetylase RimI-like enzyme